MGSQARATLQGNICGRRAPPVTAVGVGLVMYKGSAANTLLGESGGTQGGVRSRWKERAWLPDRYLYSQAYSRRGPVEQGIAPPGRSMRGATSVRMQLLGCGGALAVMKIR